MIRQEIAIIIILLLQFKEQSYSDAKIVSLPRQLYVLEGDLGVIRCQNRSMDMQTFHSYVSDALWWRRNTDGTDTRIRTYGTVYAYGHTLNFDPISSENQGNYYCCLPDESACSNVSVVIKSTPPSIRAFNSNYTAVVGSRVTLECNITDPGIPEATFGWDRDGHAIYGDIIISNNSSFALNLNNVTMEHAGMYTCTARNTVSYRSDHIELKVIIPITEDRSTIRLLAEDIKTTCQDFEIKVPIKLETFVYTNYNLNITVNTTEIKCNDDELMAICDLEFIGSMARSTLQLLTNDLSNSIKGIDFGICRLQLCHQNCTEPTLTHQNENIDKTKDSDHSLVVTILLIMVAIVFIILILLCLVFCYLRCGKKKGNIVCIPMRKCTNNDPTLKHFGSLSVGTQLDSPPSSPGQCDTPAQLISTSALSELPPGQYHTLQFNYDTEHNFPANNNLPITPNNALCSVDVMPPDHHHSFASTNNVPIHSDHNTTSSGFELVNNSDYQTNGYVLPNDFNKRPPVHTNGGTHSNSEDQFKSADKDTHKTAAVILKPDGIGIIQTGTLCAIIPPCSGSDESYTVTPSQKHESYFDIVKHT